MSKLVRIAILLAVALCAAVGATDADARNISLSPSFDPETSSYTATVPNDVSEIVFDLAAQHEKATVTVNGNAPDTRVPLAKGANTVVIVVTAEDTRYTRTYTVIVTRLGAGSGNADLSALTVESGSEDDTWSALDIGAFDAGTTGYSVTVPYGATQVRLTATAAHAKAKLKMGAPGSLSEMRSGATGAAMALSVGANTIEIEMTAENLSTKTYRLTVTREEAVVEEIEPEEAEPQEEPQESAQQQSLDPLTASFGNVPVEHDGGGAFTIDLRFSEALGERAAPSAASFAVKAGRVAGVEQVSADLWRARIQPKNWKDVTVALDLPSLSNTPSATISGPVRIRIEGARAKEGRDTTLDFAVTLNRAAPHEVSVDYATADDTATAGADYTASSGTLTFAAGETAKTVSVPVLDDAIDEGKEIMRLKLTNPRGAYLRDMHRQARGIITNDDPLQQMWLSRFGRTVGTHVMDAVSERLSGGLAPGAHATLAGKDVDLSRIGDDTALTDALAGLAQHFGAQQAPVSEDPFVHHGMGSELDARASALPVASSSRSMTARELLLGSSFHVADNGSGTGPGLAAWGRVAYGEFDGEERADDGAVSIDGEVLTGTLGVDMDYGQWLAGVSVSLSDGDGTFDDPGVDSGNIESKMTTVSPYLQYRLTERVSAWGLAGWGTGDMTIVQDAREATATQAARDRTVTKTDIDLQLGAIGARGALLTQDETGGMDLALKADAFIVRMESDKAANTVKTKADASRVRLMLEGGKAYALHGDATLRPSLEVGVRHDGGDAETGTGVELGAGMTYADPDSGLSIDASARMLVSHADSDYEEWGASATVRLDPGEHGHGLSFALAPTIGTTSSALGRLWGAHDARALAPDGGTFRPAHGLTAEAGYGLSQFGNRFTGTPNIGVHMADDGARDWRIGWRLVPAVQDDLGLEVSLDATRSEPENADVEHGVMLRSTLRW